MSPWLGGVGTATGLCFNPSIISSATSPNLGFSVVIWFYAYWLQSSTLFATYNSPAIPSNQIPFSIYLNSGGTVGISFLGSSYSLPTVSYSRGWNALSVYIPGYTDSIGGYGGVLVNTAPNFVSWGAGDNSTSFTSMAAVQTYFFGGQV